LNLLRPPYAGAIVDLNLLWPPYVLRWETGDQEDGSSTLVSRQTDEHKILSQERHRCSSKTCEEHRTISAITFPKDGLYKAYHMFRLTIKLSVRLSFFFKRSVIHLLLVVVLRPASWQRPCIPIGSFYFFIEVFNELRHAWLARVVSK